MPVAFADLASASLAAAAEAGGALPAPSAGLDGRWLLFDALAVGWALAGWAALRARRRPPFKGPRWHPPHGPIGPLPPRAGDAGRGTGPIEAAARRRDERAWRALRRRRHVQAQRALLATLRADEGRAWHWYHLGLSAAGLGRPTEAAEAYRRALELEAAHYAARFNLAGLEAACGRPAEAIRHYHVLLAAHPEAAEVHFNLGHAYFSQRLYDAARRHWQQAKRLSPREARARHNLQLLNQAAHFAPALKAPSEPTEGA